MTFRLSTALTVAVLCRAPNQAKAQLTEKPPTAKNGEQTFFTFGREQK